MEKRNCGICGEPFPLIDKPLLMMPKFLRKTRETRDGDLVCFKCCRILGKACIEPMFVYKHSTEEIIELMEKGDIKEIRRGKWLSYRMIKKSRKNLAYSERIMDRDIDIELLQTEILNFFYQKGKKEDFTAILDRKEGREIWAEDYCVIIETHESNLKLRFGRISAINTAGASAVAAVLTGGLALAAGAGIAATRRKVENDFWRYIDQIFPNISTGKETPQAKPSQHDNDIPGQIEKLASLREKGLISSEEYEDKKKDLLSRM